MAKFLRFVLLLVVLAAPGWGQIWDRTGNGKLTGTYFFRETGWQVDTFGDVTNAFALYGSLAFDGKGNYTISATFFNGQQIPYADSGTYSIAANGYGFMEHPVLAAGRLLLTVADGVVIGNSVDARTNDFLVAVPLGSATVSTFNGDYSMAYMNIYSQFVENHYDTLAKFNANGAGNIGNVAIRAYLAGSNGTPVTQTETGVKYVFQNGLGRIDFPTGQNLAIQGQQMLGISPDGNLIFGGSVLGFDFFVGVRRTTDAQPSFSGLYYQGGVNLDASNIANGGAFDTYLGSLIARDAVLLSHQRLFTPRRPNPLNYTSSADFPAAPGVEYTETGSATEWTFSADGAIRVGLGIWPYLGIALAVRAPEPATGASPYLSSIGVVNGASYAPFTAGIARGQQITLFGKGLAAAFASSGSVPLPTSIGGVEVRINNRAAPLIYVSPEQVAAIVPYGLTDEIAQVQVVRDGVISNAVTLFVYASAPGVFTQNAAGFGFGAVLDLDYQLVTAENRVDPGEFVAIYLTGLGDVVPTVQDGAPGGTVQLNETVTDPVVRIGGIVAEVQFSGLAPGYPGLYQINAKVPDGVSGDVALEVEIATGYTAQVLLPVSGGGNTARAIGPVRR